MIKAYFVHKKMYMFQDKEPQLNLTYVSLNLFFLLNTTYKLVHRPFEHFLHIFKMPFATTIGLHQTKELLATTFSPFVISPNP